MHNIPIGLERTREPVAVLDRPRDDEKTGPLLC